MSTSPLATEPAASHLGDGHGSTARSAELVRTGAVAALAGGALLAGRAADVTGGLEDGGRGAVLARADVAAVVVLVVGVTVAVTPAVVRLLGGRPPVPWRRHLVGWLAPLYALWIPVVVLDAVVVDPPASWRAWLASIVLFRDPRGAPVPGLGIGPVLTVLAITIVLVPVVERLAPRRDGRLAPRTLLRAAVLLVVVGLALRTVLVAGAWTAPFGALSWWPAHLDAVGAGLAVAVARTTGWAVTRRRAAAAALAAALFVLAAVVLPRTVLVTGAADVWLRGTLYAAIAAAVALAAGAAGRRPGRIARSLAVVAPGVVLTADVWFITIARQHVEAVVDAATGLRLAAPVLPVWCWSVSIAAASGIVLTVGVLVPLWRVQTGRWPSHGYPLAVATVVAGALLVRVATWLTIAPVKTDGGDPFFYHATANLLAAGRGFLEPHNFLDAERRIASAVHGPLYPVVLSLSSRIGGTTYVDHKFVSLLIGAAVVLVTMLLADRLGGHVAAIVAGGLAAVYPNLWLIDSLLFPEGLFALLTTTCVLVAYRWWDRPVWWLAVALGALVGLAALTRGEGLLLGPLLVAPWILLRRPLALGDRIRQLALAGLACLVVLAPWTIRNATTFDVFVPLSTNGNELIMYANCEDTYSGRLLGFWSFACQERYRDEIGEPPGDEAEKAAFWRQVGVDYAREHVGDVPRVVAARVLRQWELFRPGQTVEFATIENRDKTSTAVGLGMYYALLAASIAGALVLRRRGTRLLPLVAQFVSVTVTAAYAYGTVRFRAPVEPILCVLTGVLVAALLAPQRSAGPAAPPEPAGTA